NFISYFDAAEFCNWLSDQAGFSAEKCYRRTGRNEQPYEPVAGHRDRRGFRLLTSEEFHVSCAAGTSTRRYYGSSDLLLDRYAWNRGNSDGRSHPVASLLPNDLGLFDTLGNIWEWCDRTEFLDSKGRLIADQQGGFYNYTPTTE